MKERIWVVDDVLKTLQQLANYHRNRLNIPIIGITGSNGKTTTKELIAAVLLKKYKTVYTQGNLNNHIGVPLTLLSITKEDEIAVIEMGANHPGEIEWLCQIAQPNYGIVTNIGKAHLEGFGSIENIIETKTALYRAAPTLFVNNGDVVLKQKAESIKQKTNNSYSLTPLRSYCLNLYGSNTETDAEIVEMNPYMVIELFGNKIQTKLTGNYNLPNILAAAATGRFFGVSDPDICDTIAEYTPQNQRSQIINTGSNTLIADYYNANPTSVKAALQNFLQIDAPQKLAILGDMLELGEASAAEHQAVIQFCQNNRLEAVFIGANYYALKNNKRNFFINMEACNQYLKNKKIQNSFVLLKGSRGIHLEDILLVFTP
jgi:UDP-N-acetylmuramoyl-tripeptide--D-alanyl-D-alanine ligase